MKVSAATIACVAAASSARAFPQSAPAAAECSPLEFIDARGTSEPQVPTFGVIVGDPLYAALKKLIPDATGYAVNYPADLSPCSREIGAQDVANHLASQSAACPDQKFALAGYSQGAGVIHLGLSRIDAALYPKIIALTMFGDFGNKGSNVTTAFNTTDSDFPAPLAQRLKQNCYPRDPICANDGDNIDAHLSYNNEGETYIPDSAAYIKKQLDSNGNAGSEPSPNVGPATATKGNQDAISGLLQMLGGNGTELNGAPQSANCTVAQVPANPGCGAEGCGKK